MSPIFTHCPHCEYPIVVSIYEATYRRHCRQCGKTYTPAETIQNNGHDSAKGLRRSQRLSIKQRLKRSFQGRVSK